MLTKDGKYLSGISDILSRNFLLRPMKKILKNSQQSLGDRNDLKKNTVDSPGIKSRAHQKLVAKAREALYCLMSAETRLTVHAQGP